MRKTALLRHFDSVQNGGWCRVEGDIDHTYSTQQYVTGKFTTEFRPPPDEKFDPNWYDDIEDEKEYAHIPFEYGPDDPENPDDPPGEKAFTLEVRRRALNRSIASLRIIPEQCSNVQECRPIKQDVLLPYLTDATIVNRFERVTAPFSRVVLENFQSRLSNGSVPPAQRANFLIPESDYRCFPSAQNCLFISSTIAADAGGLFAQSELALVRSQNVTVLTRMKLYTAPGPGVVATYGPFVAHDSPTYHDQVHPGDDGLYGLPLKHEFDEPSAPFPALETYRRDVYQLDLEKWKLSVALEVFGQDSDGSLNAGALDINRFEFKFPAGSMIEIVFGKNGRATTRNVSPADDRIPDTETFHVFKIWDKDAHGLVDPGGGGQDQADYANGIPFGNMVRPLASDGAVCALYLAVLQAGVFPLENAGAVQAYYLYIPIRRYARQSVQGYPEPCSQLSRFFAPRKIEGETQVNVFERHNAHLAWQLRNVQDPNLPENGYTFPHGENLQDRLGTTTYGQVLPGFSEANGTDHLRDFDYVLTHLILQGQIADWLNAIRVAGGIPGATKYSFVLRFTSYVTRDNIGVLDAAPELFKDIRYEMVVFKKSDIVVHQGHICLAHTAWKMPLDIRQLHSDPANPNTIALGLFNLAAIYPLRLGHLLENTQSIEPGFHDITRVDALPNARMNRTRPAADPPLAPTILKFNYSVGDSTYTNAPPQGAYYQRVIGGVPALHGGQPDYELPRQPPLWREAAENVELAHVVNANVADPRMDTIVESLTADVLFLDDDSSHFRLGDLPVVRNWPQEFTLKESLLGFYGMSPYLPSSIYPILKQFPSFLQSFVYNFRRESPPNCARLTKVFANGVVEYIDNVSSHLIPKGEVKLTLESYNTFEQADKELEDVDLPWPKFEIFTSVSAYNEQPRLTLKTIKGGPDFVFLYMTHVYPDGTHNTFHNPTITGIRMDIRGQELKCVSSLDELALYQLTRRNSHIQADSTLNDEEIGGVLLTKEDCGGYQQFNEIQGTDLFEMDVTVTSHDYLHKDKKDEKKWITKELDLKLHVLFIYSDFSLKGKAHEARFWWR